MTNYPLNQTYNETMKQLQTTDKVHADTFNPMFSQLLNNDSYLHSSLADMSTNVKLFGAKGDGTTDDTLAIQNAINSLGVVGGIIYFPPGTYAISSISVSYAKVSFKGAGKFISQIVRHSAYLQQETDLVSIQHCSEVNIFDLGFDQKGNGQSGSTKSCVSILRSNNVTVENNYFTNGQYHGLALTVCNNNIIKGNYFLTCYYDGIALGGSDGTPDGSYKTVITQNICENIYGGIIAQVYCYDTIINHNVLKQSGIQIGQEVNRLTIDSNIIESYPTYGYSARYDGIFVESDTDVTISNNQCRDMTGYGIYVNGTSLQGTPIQMQRIKVIGNQVYNTTLQGIVITMNSSPTFNYGDTLTVDHNTVADCNAGILVSGGDGSMIKGNYVYHCKYQGMVISQCKHTTMANNTIRDTGYSAPNSYAGIELTNNNIDIWFENNTFIDDQASSTMYFGVWDKVLDGGTASQARYKNNTFSGMTPVYPALAAPTIGTWKANDEVQIPNAGAGTYEKYKCTTAGTANNTAWAASTAYIVGKQVNTGGNVYECITAGTSGTVAPTGTASDITDGTVHWKYVGVLAVFKGVGLIAS